MPLARSISAVRRTTQNLKWSENECEIRKTGCVLKYLIVNYFTRNKEITNSLVAPAGRSLCLTPLNLNSARSPEGKRNASLKNGNCLFHIDLIAFSRPKQEKEERDMETDAT